MVPFFARLSMSSMFMISKLILPESDELGIHLIVSIPLE